jgi:hypothetical protein
MAETENIPLRTPGKAKRRPRLPTEASKFRARLWDEIKRGPDGEQSVPKFAATVAQTIVERYTIPRRLQQLYVLDGLTAALTELLAPPEEDEALP